MRLRSVKNCAAEYGATDQLECVVGQLVLVAHVDLDQQGAVCGDGAQGEVAQLLAAVGRVLQQARRLRGQRAHAVILHVPAVGDVDLRHVLPA